MMKERYFSERFKMTNRSAYGQAIDYLNNLELKGIKVTQFQISSTGDQRTGPGPGGWRDIDLTEECFLFYKCKNDTKKQKVVL
jgi:hypothetical protein